MEYKHKKQSTHLEVPHHTTPAVLGHITLFQEGNWDYTEGCRLVVRPWTHGSSCFFVDLIVRNTLHSSIFLVSRDDQGRRGLRRSGKLGLRINVGWTWSLEISFFFFVPLRSLSRTKQRTPLPETPPTVLRLWTPKFTNQRISPFIYQGRWSILSPHWSWGLYTPQTHTVNHPHGPCLKLLSCPVIFSLVPDRVLVRLVIFFSRTSCEPVSFPL